MGKEVINFEDFLPKRELVKIKCGKKENIIDREWLFSNLHWKANNDNKLNHIVFDDEIIIYEITVPWDSEMKENDEPVLLKINFDNVTIDTTHSFGGNEYTYHFKLGDKGIIHATSEGVLGFSKDEVKKKYVDRLNTGIEKFSNRIKRNENLIKKIRTL